MDFNEKYILDYFILKIVDDLVKVKIVESDVLKYCYNHKFMDRAREIIPNKVSKELLLNRISKTSLSKAERNILFNIIQAYNLSSDELKSIKTKLMNSISGLFAFFSFEGKLNEKDYLNAFEFIENNWADFKEEELKYEDPRSIKFENTILNLTTRIEKSAENKRWLYLFSNKAFEEYYNRPFLGHNSKIEIINLYKNHSVFSKRLKLKLLK